MEAGRWMMSVRDRAIKGSVPSEGVLCWGWGQFEWVLDDGRWELDAEIGGLGDQRIGSVRRRAVLGLGCLKGV